MARGTSRAPSQNAYRGSLGRTQTMIAHVTGPRGDTAPSTVHTTVDAVSNPELAEKLLAGTLNTGVPVPVLYHDPAAELMVLVLADVHRHRELDERISILTRMRDESTPIPAYAKDFVAVYGSAALRELVEKKTREALTETSAAETKAELEKRTRELERRARDLEERTRSLEARTRELEAAKAEIERLQAEGEQLRREARARVLASVPQPQPQPQQVPVQVTDIEIVDAVDVVESTTIGPAPTAPDIETREVERQELDEIGEQAERFHAKSAEPIVDVDGEDNDANPTDDPEEDDDGGKKIPVDVSVVLAVPPRKRAPSASEDDDEEELLPVNGHPGHRPNEQAAAAPEAELDEEPTGAAIIPQGSDPLTTQTTERPLDASDPWLDKVIAREQSAMIAEPKGPVRLALIAGDQLARGLGGNLDVRVLLQRTPHYPVVTFVVGPPAAMRVPSTSQLAVVPLDLSVEGHRAVMTALARKFELQVDVVVRGRRIRRVVLTAPLAENIGYLVRSSDDHLRAVTSSGAASYERGRELVLSVGYDILGTEHPDNAEFRDDKLAQLSTAQNLRRALAIARRFARPAREDYLVCTRGFPLPRWRELRRHVLESAVAWGLWMGPELAQMAVSEGLARSRRELILRLDAGFEKLKANETAFDIDAEAAADNAKAIGEEARALGVELPKLNGKAANHRAPAQVPVTSEDMPQVSGSIGGTPPSGIPRQKTVDELLAELDDRQHRVAAALELCDRGDARAAAPVIAAVTKMSRAEAVRVLGMSVKFGDAAAQPLMAGLNSSKGFLRHGCALALALLRTEDGIQAVIDLLLNEPTEIWREVARAIGQVGPQGLLPLAANFGRLGDRATPQIAERVAWAMAHIAVRGGKAAVETMAHGHSVVAPVARHALELHGSAANDHVRVRPGADGSQAGRDVTVNRAFSRRFFEALEQGLPDAAAAGLEALDASSPMELLDESDLVLEDDEEAELDESDLIQ
ncbi:MAG: hypothetical protein SFX73_36665 [Kofleriaceae bacterium]|nr:hypothetical protein [Kofleriaceae bacterium]